MPSAFSPILATALATSSVMVAADALGQFFSPAVQRISSTWNCTVLSNTSLAPSVFWTKHNCTGFVPGGPLAAKHVGPIIVNIAHARLSADPSSPVLRPAVAKPGGLAKLHQLAESVTDGNPDFVPLAGVNGGFFWEVDRQEFFDDVCFGKTRKDAMEPVSAANPNAGVGDSLTVVAGEYTSYNCDMVGNSKPVAAVLDYPPRFLQLDRAGKVPNGTQWAIAAGPNLVSFDPQTNQSFVSIEGDNVNILEHASNTGLAIKGDMFMLVEFDGEDGCTEYKPKCGINSHQFAAFMLDELKVHSAMEMDQGGSTAMWVAGQPGSVAGQPGIVSNPGDGERNLYNGIFIGIPKPK